jgi:hypothetical protein
MTTSVIQSWSAWIDLNFGEKALRKLVEAKDPLYGTDCLKIQQSKSDFLRPIPYYFLEFSCDEVEQMILEEQNPLHLEVMLVKVVAETGREMHSLLVWPRVDITSNDWLLIRTNLKGAPETIVEVYDLLGSSKKLVHCVIK